jgi:hypothetical protein
MFPIAELAPDASGELATFNHVGESSPLDDRLQLRLEGTIIPASAPLEAIDDPFIKVPDQHPGHDSNILSQ